jgi:hypothetical protein
MTMTALEILGTIQPHLAGMVKELPDGPAKTAAEIAAGAAPAILAGMPTQEGGGQTRAWLESVATLLLQQLPKVLPQTGAVGVATSVVIQFLPEIVRLVTVEKVRVVYEESDLEHPPEIV